jgi:signal transduction histidine kinase
MNAMQERLRAQADDMIHMLAAVAHDLRTPLTGLRLRAETAPPDTVSGNQDQWSGHLAATAPYLIGQPQGTMKPQLRVAPAAALPDLDVEPSLNFRPSLSRTV